MKTKKTELELLRELVEVGRDMRANQKLWFKYKKHSALEQAKRAENRFDELLNKVSGMENKASLHPKETAIQTKLIEV
ncbi:MAG: hypothetical protein VKL42_12490 [Snowella sp.]|nr:hypothetical protein [Snowella sp.]